MAGSINKVILVGHLGRDPEVRTSQAGTKIVNLTLATSEGWKDKHSGERKESTEWHRIVVFNERLAEFAEKYCSKGRKAFIEGQLKTRKWTDQQGIERYITEVVVDRFRGELVLLDSKDQRQSQSQQKTQSQQTQSGWNTMPGNNDIDDEIPF